MSRSSLSASRTRQSEAIDARKLSTSKLNSEIRTLVERGKGPIIVRNPDARHNLAVGILKPCRISFEGSVGYYACAYCDGVDATINGNAGWGLADNLMSGRIVVLRDAGASVGASMRGGEILVLGDAGARAGISMKGGTLVVAGNSGFLTGFMMQKGRVVVLGDVGGAAGDSMYEGTIYYGGKVESLGADAEVKPLERREKDEILSVLRKMGVRDDNIPRSFSKVVSKKKLYHYDSLEPLERERLVI